MTDYEDFGHRILTGICLGERWITIADTNIQVDLADVRRYENSSDCLSREVIAPTALSGTMECQNIREWRCVLIRTLGGRG
jgi:hypothetical protein